MAHNINTVNGVASIAYNVRNGRPWHGLGQVVEGYMRPMEALTLANGDYGVAKVPLFLASGERVLDKVATVRTDTGAYLATVGTDYGVLLNRAVVEFIETLAGYGAAVVDVLGILGRGERGFATVRLPGTILVADGDTVEKNVVVSWGHDGITALEAFRSAIRAVCENTVRAALAGASGERVKIRHTSGIVDAVKAAGKLLKESEEHYAEVAAMWRILASIRLQDNAVMAYFKAMFPESEARPGQSRAVVADLMERYRTAPGADMARGTAWGAYNAITHRVSHGDAPRKGETAEGRFDRVLFGSGADLSGRALTLALTLGN